MSLHKYFHFSYLQPLLVHSKLFLTRNISRTQLLSTQREMILKTINEANNNELEGFKLSPKLKNKIISERNNCRDRKFDHFDQLGNCGLDKLKRKVLSSIILNMNYSSKELQNFISFSLPNVMNENFHSNKDLNFIDCKSIDTQKKLKSLKRLVISDYDTSNVPYSAKNIIVSLSLPYPDIGWTVMNRSGEVLDMFCDALDIDTNLSKIFNSHDFYYKVSSILSHLPECDFLIAETPLIHTINPNNSRISTLLHGIFMAYFDKGRAFHPLTLFKCAILDKVFDLKVGKNRRSVKDMGDEILAGRSSISWMHPVTFASAALEKYILSTTIEKHCMIESLLLGLVFDHLFLKKDLNVLSHLNV